ncbi:V-type ATP synthase subunit I [Trichloromonas sp.]|uniref:V-type ATP synthase subunit I n=1 Tax=Trichloromonas sp. TaxID=3069249 RepID=UPI003D81B711
MSKIEIIGPIDLLLPVLVRMRQFGVLHIEEHPRQLVDAKEPHLKSLQLDSQSLAGRIFYQDLKQKIETLLTGLPQVKGRETYLNPATALEAVSTLVDRHIASCRSLEDDLVKEKQRLEELADAERFLTTIAPLVGGISHGTSLEFIGLELTDPEAVEQLTYLVHRLTGGRFDLQSTEGPQGSLAVLISTQKGQAAELRQLLRRERLPEFPLPSSLEALPFERKLEAIRDQVRGAEERAAALNLKLKTFARRWLGIYRAVLNWINDQLPLLEKTALLYQTGMCFFIFGWIPSGELAAIQKELDRAFAGKVVVEQKAIQEEELDRVPVALKNPPYFEPFELFSRLLPLPRYTSYDPTLFLGLFFPLFFGMILGDIGYGAILALTALPLIFFSRRKLLRDAGKILSVSALYTMIFGWLFGECFGEFGSHLLGLEPIIFDRRTAIVPMLYFALSIGICHLLTGLLLGLFSALRQRLPREVLLKSLSLLGILCLLFFVGAHFIPSLPQIQKQLLVVLGIVLPLLILTGGLLAPLELLKTFGNIISYARIMAVGLTSVLLAHVANELAGVTGDVLLGILVAVLLHAFNLILGVFAPTIHSLRLHYVEFFGKFLEPGGKRFTPMKK